MDNQSSSKGGIVMVLLGIAFGIGVTSFIEYTPKHKAAREVARCTEVARIMMGRVWQVPPEAVNEQSASVLNATFECLKIR